jgi:hypothetical protein
MEEGEDEQTTPDSRATSRASGHYHRCREDEIAARSARSRAGDRCSRPRTPEERRTGRSCAAHRCTRIDRRRARRIALVRVGEPVHRPMA